MNHDELDNLIRKLETIATNLDGEISELKNLQTIREASRNTGRRPATDYAAESTGDGEGSHNRTKEQEETNDDKKRFKIRDKVMVTRGRLTGTTAVIIRETKTQYVLRAQDLIGTFRKWKNSIQKPRKNEQ